MGIISSFLGVLISGTGAAATGYSGYRNNKARVEAVHNEIYAQRARERDIAEQKRKREEEEFATYKVSRIKNRVREFDLAWQYYDEEINKYIEEHPVGSFFRKQYGMVERTEDVTDAELEKWYCFNNRDCGDDALIKARLQLAREGYAPSNVKDTVFVGYRPSGFYFSSQFHPGDSRYDADVPVMSPQYYNRSSREEDRARLARADAYFNGLIMKEMQEEEDKELQKEEE